MGKSLQYELRTVLRDRMVMGILLLSLAYFALGQSQLSLLDYNILAYFHQMILWWMGLMGYRMGREYRRCSEWAEPIGAADRLLEARMQALFVCVVLICATVIVSMTVHGAKSHASPGLLWESVLATFLHYGLGGLIAGGIGLLIGRSVASVSGYAVVLIVLFFMGPVGFPWVRSATQFLPIGMQRFLILPWELGVHQFRTSVDAFYGFEIEWPLWVHRGLLLSGIAWLLQTGRSRTVRRPARNAQRIALVAVTAGLLVLHAASGNVPLRNALRSERHDSHALYYEQKESEHGIEPGFDWESVSLEVDPTTKLTVEGTAVAKFYEDREDLRLNLYHGLELETLEIEGTAIDFQTEGDVITAALPVSKKQGESVNVSFSYRGDLPKEFYVGKATFLPGYFNWIPQPARGDSVRWDGQPLVLPIHGKTPPVFAIRVRGKAMQVVSPTGTDSSAWEFGPTLLRGTATAHEYGGRKIFTSALFAAENVAAYAEELLHVRAQFEKIFDLSSPSIRTVVSTFERSHSIGGWSGISRASGSVLFVGDERSPHEKAHSIVLGETELEEREEGLVMEALVGLLVDQYHFCWQSTEMQGLFLDAVDLWVTGKAPRRMSHEALVDFLAETNDPSPFLAAWFQAMNTDEVFTVEALVSLLDKHR